MIIAPWPSERVRKVSVSCASVCAAVGRADGDDRDRYRTGYGALLFYNRIQI